MNHIQQQILNLLGLATRANKLVTGDELVTKALQKGKIELVFCASDCSDNTKNKFQNKCEVYDVPFLTLFDSNDLSLAIGKQRSIIGVTDKGFAKSILSKKGQTQMEE